nr:hypothetical protein [Tanacetum cinerariifolium]
LRYMTGNISYLSDFEEISGGYVAFGGNLKGGKITCKGYDNQVFNNTVFDCDELISSESDASMPTSPVHDRYQSGEGYYAVPPPYTGTFMAPKPDLVSHDAPTANETIPTVLNVEPSTTKPNKDMSQLNRPSAPIIKDWVFDSEDEYEDEPISTQKAPSFVQTSKHVKTPRTFVKPVEHPTPAAHLRKDIPKTKGHRHRWNRKAYFVCKNLTYLIKDCDYYEKKMVQKPARNHAMQGNHQHYARMTHSYPNTHVVPTSVLTRSKLVPLIAARPITTAIPQTKVPHHRPAKHIVNKAHSPIRRLINLRTSPKNSNFHQKVTTVKANQGNLQHALKDKGVINSGCSRHMTWNISYLPGVEEINGGYVKQKPDGIFISQDKYVAKILRKFGLTNEKSASTPIDTKKPLLKNPDVKRIFGYLKGKLHLGLWYPKDSPFNLVAYSDSDYARASLDRKSTTGGCQFLGRRLISWQCKKHTVVATSLTKAEYVAATSCCAQVLWIQNQLMDYGKFGLTNEKSASTPIDTKKPLLKDPDGEDVNVHTYRSMIGSLIYLTSSRPDIMFAVCACAFF